MPTAPTVIDLFTSLIALQFLAVVCHDLVDIPGLVSGSQVQAVAGKGKVWMATLVNSIFPGLAVAFAVYFWRRPAPAFVPNYWVIYCAVALVSAIGMWYLPYLRGVDERQSRAYRAMYAGTRQLLPARGDNPRPNLFHIAMHALFVVNLALALWLRFSSI